MVPPSHAYTTPPPPPPPRSLSIQHHQCRRGRNRRLRGDQGACVWACLQVRNQRQPTHLRLARARCVIQAAANVRAHAHTQIRRRQVTTRGQALLLAVGCFPFLCGRSRLLVCSFVSPCSCLVCCFGDEIKNTTPVSHTAFHLCAATVIINNAHNTHNTHRLATAVQQRPAAALLATATLAAA